MSLKRQIDLQKEANIQVDIVSESKNKIEVNWKSNLEFVASGIGGRERYMV